MTVRGLSPRLSERKGGKSHRRCGNRGRTTSEHCGWRRLSAGTVVAALLAGTFGLWAPATVEAALYNPIPFDANGPNDLFTDSDALFAYVTSDIAGGTVCIVPASVESPSEGGCSAWGSPNFIVGIGSIIQLIEAPPLKVGTWKLLTEDTDGNPTGLSGEFTVVPCGGCSRTFSDSVVSQWKSMARANVTGAALTCATMTALDEIDSKRNLEWSTGGATFITFGATFGGGFAFDIASPLDVSANKAKEILKDLSCAVEMMYQNIADTVK